MTEISLEISDKNNLLNIWGLNISTYSSLQTEYASISVAHLNKMWNVVPVSDKTLKLYRNGRCLFKNCMNSVNAVCTYATELLNFEGDEVKNG